MKTLINKPQLKLAMIIGVLLLFTACQSEGNKTASSDIGFVAGAANSDQDSGQSPSANNFNVFLKDAKLDNVSEAIVNIKEIVLKVNGSGKKGSEISIAQNIGPVDLMTLHSGKTFNMADINLPIGTKVNQIRLILEEDGHYLMNNDGSVCELQTPSQQNTGLKINNPVFEIEEGQAYSLVVDFNSEKSLVFQGNDGCLLKPVLKWGGVTSSPINEDPVVEDPVVEDPVVEDPVVEDPVVEDPVVQDPVVEDPVVEDPVVEDPVVQDPVVEDPVVQDPVVEDPVVQDPVVEDPVVQDPVVEDPVVQDPVVEDPVVQDPVVEDPVVQDPVVEDPVVQDPVVEDPVVEDPVSNEPDMEMCYNVSFDLFDSSTWPADFVYEDYAHCY